MRDLISLHARWVVCRSVCTPGISWLVGQICAYGSQKIHLAKNPSYFWINMASSDSEVWFGRNLFCYLCLPEHSLHYLPPPLRKCNNLREGGQSYECSEFSIICVKSLIIVQALVLYVWFYVNLFYFTCLCCRCVCWCRCICVCHVW